MKEDFQKILNECIQESVSTEEDVLKGFDDVVNPIIINKYTIICPSCGNQLKEVFNFCPNCSQMINTEIPVTNDFKELVDEYKNTDESLIDKIYYLLEDDLFRLDIIECLNNKLIIHDEYLQDAIREHFRLSYKIKVTGTHSGLYIFTDGINKFEVPFIVKSNGYNTKVRALFFDEIKIL